MIRFVVVGTLKGACARRVLRGEDLEAALYAYDRDRGQVRETVVWRNNEPVVALGRMGLEGTEKLPRISPELRGQICGQGVELGDYDVRERKRQWKAKRAS